MTVATTPLPDHEEEAIGLTWIVEPSSSDAYFTWATQDKGGAKLFHETHMTSYRLYCLDGAGNIGLADWIEAESDEIAIAKAHQLKGGALQCEVWEGNRLVAKLGADDLMLGGQTSGSLPQLRPVIEQAPQH